MRMRIVTGLLPSSLAFLGIAAAGSSPDQSQTVTFAEAVRAADANSATPEGKRYDGQLAQFASEHEGAAMGACVEASKVPDMSSFQVVLRLTAKGKVNQALVKPETNVGVCFRDKMKTEAFPAPPKADYWIRIDMQLRP